MKKTLFFFVITACVLNKLSAQYIGMGVETFMSGSGHGAYVSGYMALNKGNSSLRMGPCFQASALKLNGVRLSYSYKLAGRDAETTSANFDELPNGSMILNAFSYAQYLNKAALSDRRIKIETATSIDKGINWSNVNLSTVETGVGIELDIKVNKWLQMRNFISLSMYYNVDYIEGMYQARTAPAISFGTGINIPGF